MKLQEFVENVHCYTDNFADCYVYSAVENKKMFPMELDNADEWMEQLLAYIDMENKL